MGLCSSFIDGLPQGLDSFPEAQGRLDLFGDLYAETPAEIVDERLVGAMTRYARQSDEKWIPEVVCAAILSAHAEAQHDEGAFLEAMLGRNLDIYRRPLFRGLMFVLSPTLALMGAAARWSTFHRGTTLTVEKWERSRSGSGARMRLSHPPGLFVPLHHRAYGEAFRAAAIATRAHDVRIECTSSGDGAVFDVEYER